MIAVIDPDAIITSISIGATTMLPSPSNKNPEPKRYKWPLKRIISPIYIINVTTDATIDGISTESVFFFSSRNEPTYTPAVTPKMMKNKLISTAERVDTVISPSLKNAVKQAKMQRPRNKAVDTDWITSAFSLLLFLVIIIWAKP